MLEYLLNLRARIWDVLSLTEGTDVEKTIRSISDGVSIRGANIWILLCGAILASIGLDINSSAIIIGAMLISPLMQPILGIGLGIGISDRELLVRAIRNFSLAVGISLFTSTVYFMLSPLGQETSEMVARIKPTLLDVGVAIFGGMAGIIANSRRKETNALPGVAIATALMPPLCTAGYGIAKGSTLFFFGAFYLFFINAVFISLSTYVMVRLLKFPIKEFVDYKTKKRIQTGIATLALVVMVPSMYIFYNVIIEAQVGRSVNTFLDEQIKNELNDEVGWELMKNDSATTLKVYVIGEFISKDKERIIEAAMKNYDLGGMKLKLVQMNVPKEERDRIKTEVAGEVARNVMRKIELTKEVQSKKDKYIDSLTAVIENLKFSNRYVRKIQKEINVLFPEIQSTSFGLINDQTNDSLFKLCPVIVYNVGKKLRSREKLALEIKFTNYLKLRLGRDSVITLMNRR